MSKELNNGSLPKMGVCRVWDKWNKGQENISEIIIKIIVCVRPPGRIETFLQLNKSLMTHSKPLIGYPYHAFQAPNRVPLS